MRGGCERNGAKNWRRGGYDDTKKGKEIEREGTRKRRRREEGDVGGKVRRRGRTGGTENRREKWGIYKEGGIGREVEEPERMENQLECKRAIETAREKEMEKKKRKRGKDARSSCRGDCADVRGKVLCRALPDLTTPPLPSRVGLVVAWSD